MEDLDAYRRFKMGFRINTNVASLTAQKQLGKTNRESTDLSAKLSSGSRITKSADDAAGLAISEKLQSHIRSSRQANRNANDGISMVQVAEGALGEVTNMLTRLRELGVQSASDTIGDQERSFTNMEYQQLVGEIQRVSEVTEFNGHKLLNGSGETLDFQIGINNDDFQDRIQFNTSEMDTSTSNLGIEGGIDSKSGAQDSLAAIDGAITKVVEQRAQLGAIQNRLTVTSNNIENSVEGMSQANSRIRDLDYAEATAENARLSLLQNAGTSVLAQTQVSQQNALRLLS